MSRTIFCALVISFFTGILPGFQKSVAQLPPIETRPVELAVVGPMAGTSSSVGIQYKTGVIAALEALPEGRLLGREVRMTAYNDSCTRDIAERVAQDLTHNPPDVVIGHSCSAATIIAAPIYSEHDILQITPASTSPRVTEMGIPTIFRMIGRDDIQGEMAADRIAMHYPDNKVGILYFPSEYSTQLAQTAINRLAVHGITPAKVMISSASATSYITEIQAFTEAGIEVLYMVGGGLDSAVFVRQTSLLESPFDIISVDTLVSSVFPETAGSAAEQVPFTFPTSSSELLSAASAISAIRASGIEPDGYTLFTYAAVEVWAEGVRRAGNFETAAVAEAIRSAPIETIFGPVSFDAKGDIQTTFPAFSWYIWRNGERVRMD